MTMAGLIFDIRHYTIHDGPGIRTTVFFKGCPLRCRWCHNPESQEPKIEEASVERVLDGKLFVNQLAVGSWQLAENVMNEILKDVVFYQESGGGVTFSGGEPLMQPDFLAEMLIECKKTGIHTVVDTCGHAEPAALAKCMEFADLWLFDLKLMDDVKHVEFTGVSNELIMENLATLSRSKKDIIIRFPVIPGITDEGGNLEAIVLKMKKLGLKKISLLPFHAIARDKYRRMGREFMLEEAGEPDEKRMSELRSYFINKELDVSL
jgi:pyruvate formate lyase activating enzyme